MLETNRVTNGRNCRSFETARIVCFIIDFFVFACPLTTKLFRGKTWANWALWQTLRWTIYWRWLSKPHVTGSRWPNEIKVQYTVYVYSEVWCHYRINRDDKQVRYVRVYKHEEYCCHYIVQLLSTTTNISSANPELGMLIVKLALYHWRYDVVIMTIIIWFM